MPTSKVNSSVMARFLFENIIARFGCPYLVRIDNGKEFKGEFSALLENFGIKYLHSAPYYSQSNGMVERVNLTI